MTYVALRVYYDDDVGCFSTTLLLVISRLGITSSDSS